MDALQWMFLEEPLYVYVVLAVAELALVARWHSRRTAGAAKLLILPLLLGGAVFALERLVVTDREQIQQAIRLITDDFRRERFEAPGLYIDREYHGFGGEKADLLKRGKAECRRGRIKSIGITWGRINVTGKNAEMKITTTVHLKGQAGGGVVSFAWDINWIKRQDGWRIVRLSKPRSVVPGFGG